ncbi:MAG: type II toxin-antitoxin system Phd/YefM family antitoxin [Candidatus Eisenbacteria bacterium]|uniref:Antitoxin n=1 Tax=Eiseniibacteriota bacterium TaxID=2212470 RepID=A0A948WAT7_UNCEI|nr:type II toxin-antitoxin system Phd/YefM family antitoxin [Candidatus Eisenbacteria bacterium]MBU1947620.1 type II toxin-antitoxin system Phd/YefM family antitoxin [Candidatus Eisenbacteria bacterium]MBU2689348.1 type II toxin-antitoxin system Phd/YefM family antitoxin [Candidatus Eisenbacteria bacterium]
MAKVPNIIPISDLRQDAAAVLRNVRGNQKPLIITQRGRAAAVMLSIEAYEAAEEERAILRQLARGEREIDQGVGFSLKKVMAEADRLLAEEES